MKKLALVALLAVAGCKTGPRYVDGQMLQLGLYVPTSDGLVGLQVMNWLSGVEVTSTTNMPFRIERDYSATNSYLGVVNINEHVHTSIESKNK